VLLVRKRAARTAGVCEARRWSVRVAGGEGTLREVVADSGVGREIASSARGTDGPMNSIAQAGKKGYESSVRACARTLGLRW